MEHLQQRPVRKQHQGNGRTYPELVVSPPVSNQEATYHAALELVAQIDEDLTLGIRHYRNNDGKLLLTLDEVVRAILNDDLMLDEQQIQPEVVWFPTQELAA